MIKIITFELTNACNFNCVHCFHDERGNCLSKERALELLKSMKGEGASTLILTGGEPTIYPYFDCIYRSAKEYGYKIELFTNGSRICHWSQLFEELPPDLIHVSLYGFDKASYQKICGEGNSFKNVYNGLKILKANDIPFKLNILVLTLNYNEIIKGNMDFWQEHFSVEPLFVYYLYDSLMGNDRKSFSINAHQVTDLLSNKLPKRIDKLKKRFETSSPEWFTCKAGLERAYIRSDGHLCMCTMDTNAKIMADEPDALKRLASRRLKLEKESISIPCSSCSDNQGCIECPVQYKQLLSFDAACSMQRKLKEAILHDR